GRAVVISRGELVEIGDTFRIAEIVERSGAKVLEVGATNRTHLADYKNAPGAAALLKVHRSNYHMAGFVSDVDSAALAQIKTPDVPLIHDLGSGLIQDFDDIGLPHEQTAREAIQLGADVVTMSGDKLLGGPQAGIIVGKAELIERMRRNPLCRALRVDKLTIAALEATLQCYARGTARSEIPVLRMIAMSKGEIEERAKRFQQRLQQLGVSAEAVSAASTIGGGAYPGVELPSAVVRISGDAKQLETKLRSGRPPVVARVADNHVVIDLRTVLPEQESILAELIAHE
ncbi:MAG TPA: L-seryl-tRNA(Sec) selenium transferase, partial [Longimicrobiales bacterium]|nr:L-seryl-tRNA(Sec) selenium transferase [Longimicrobiales bacterium]